ncbi:hypothetical protein PYCCODRAFT_265136 [Trametes coccinea BRFM310]|uniref:Uncharacterized protein n=1 Tax=Trametes coccinea (strain BRFM310) TaxID=1353009 RepID=A0A1Y2IRP2_TRAC3|nr:hypothetical protein PYCCODRAFT_265136 [Trametes coccinea BRFM310]
MHITDSAIHPGQRTSQRHSIERATRRHKQCTRSIRDCWEWDGICVSAPIRTVVTNTTRTSALRTLPAATDSVYAPRPSALSTSPTPAGQRGDGRGRDRKLQLAAIPPPDCHPHQPTTTTTAQPAAPDNHPNTHPEQTRRPLSSSSPSTGPSRWDGGHRRGGGERTQRDRAAATVTRQNSSARGVRERCDGEAREKRDEKMEGINEGMGAHGAYSRRGNNGNSGNTGRRIYTLDNVMDFRGRDDACEMWGSVCKS